MTTNEKLALIDKYVTNGWTSEELDFMCHDLSRYLDSGKNEPDWNKYSKGSIYYESRLQHPEAPRQSLLKRAARNLTELAKKRPWNVYPELISDDEDERWIEHGRVAVWWHTNNVQAVFLEDELLFPEYIH